MKQYFIYLDFSSFPDNEIALKQSTLHRQNHIILSYCYDVIMVQYLLIKLSHERTNYVTEFELSITEKIVSKQIQFFLEVLKPFPEDNTSTYGFL